ncbi:MAG: type IV secretion system DNA-binding domain-containing protein [Sphingopyxis sp.]|uniref:type IV secretion system DNA-binding domain-containing protein n=1 Tax=Sphingopyxis sp. TaxID=1908224 RepID=UPI001A2ACF6F|nr:type IV secretion system DNA-binding domain-containing protein [Sphingopyxis sp.]MBJ7499671.1 type IV secretion system DNA-binding domain-containing protein [Sphingopyxis sp.]
MALPDKRIDIRSDGRAVPLTHHSARGKVQRNSGNFTRGSQLLTHEVLMFLAGAKLPFLVWFLVFALAYSLILAFTLAEHEIQLILMKIYAFLWDWVEFDPMKRVNLELPDGSIRYTVMAIVQSVPQVEAAWAKALRGILGAILVATFAAIPLGIWFVDLSRRRGKTILQERHERGAMLVDFGLLHAEVVAHNRARFETEARELFPDRTPADVLAMPFAERKAGGIHHPYSLAGVPWPHRLEQSHAMLIGTTGAGKTTELRNLVRQMRQRDDNAVIFDLTGAYVEAFYDPERDTILNPMDQRCPAWSIFNDCSSYSHFTSAAAALIPADGGSSEPFWALAARTLFIEMCVRLQERGQGTNLALSENLMTADLKRVHRYLVNTIADPLTAPEAARMAESIRAVFNTNAQVLRFLPDEGEPFSIRRWMTAEKQPGAILFVTSSYDDMDLNRPLLTLWMNLAITSLMTMPRTRSLRTWFMFDEVGALHRLPAIEKGLQTARNFGGAMILGLHSFQKLVEVYGEEGARNLASLARTKLILATGEIKTAEECSQYIGSREVRQMDEAYSYGYNQTRDASTLTPRKQIEPLVIADDITNLPSMCGYVKFPDGFPAARIELEWRNYPIVAEGFLARPNIQPVRSRRAEAVFHDEGDSEAGGRDGAVQMADPTAEPLNIARDLAANILNNEPEETRHTANAAGILRDADGNVVNRATSTTREGPDNRQTEADGAAVRGDRARDERIAPMRSTEVEDQTLRELREDYGSEREADRDDFDVGL